MPASFEVLGRLPVQKPHTLVCRASPQFPEQMVVFSPELVNDSECFTLSIDLAKLPSYADYQASVTKSALLPTNRYASAPNSAVTGMLRGTPMYYEILPGGGIRLDSLAYSEFWIEVRPRIRDSE